jgi:scyllo-inositol 2-dehydrogenase (NADP+)
MEKPNVVVVGYGFAGRCFHAYLVGLATELNLYGIVTSREQARAQIQQQLGVKTFARFEDVLKDPQVDLVVLATPNDLHAPHAIQAMEAGKHVVTDKPMCLDLAEADAMIAASRKSDRLLSIFQNRRWDGDFLTVRSVLEEGLLGDLYQIEMAWMGHSRPRTWRSENQRGGGKFVDLGAHMIDQALQLIAAPVEQIYARFHTGIWDNDVEDHAHCIISFANGVDVHIDTSSLARASKPRWYLLGSAGTLVKEGLDPQEKAMIAGDIDAAREDPAHCARLYAEVVGQAAETVVETVPGRWRSYYENIAAALQGREELAVTPESVRAVMRVIGAAQHSAARNQAVRLDEIDGA